MGLLRCPHGPADQGVAVDSARGNESDLPGVDTLNPRGVYHMRLCSLLRAGRIRKPATPRPEPTGRAEGAGGRPRSDVRNVAPVAGPSNDSAIEGYRFRGFDSRPKAGPGRASYACLMANTESTPDRGHHCWGQGVNRPVVGAKPGAPRALIVARGGMGLPPGDSFRVTLAGSIPLAVAAAGEGRAGGRLGRGGPRGGNEGGQARHALCRPQTTAVRAGGERGEPSEYEPGDAGTAVSAYSSGSDGLAAQRATQRRSLDRRGGRIPSLPIATAVTASAPLQAWRGVPAGIRPA